MAQKITLMLALRFTLVISLLAASWPFAVPLAWAVQPPPDGGYANANTAEGTDALFSLTIGSNNTAIGYIALHNNTTGDYNTATGGNALSANFSGGANTADGYNALAANTTGLANTAVGKDCMEANTSGSVNTATGDVALSANVSGSANTATGVNALALNTSASSNTADGYGALMNNSTGANNTASGANALQNNIAGNNNIGLGYQAGVNLTSGDNNIAIGNVGNSNDTGKIRIGTQGMQDSAFIAGIFGTTLSRGVTVAVDNKGRLGTITSSERFKEHIQPMGSASESILGLRPVAFRYRAEVDPESAPQFGLVAEQVAKINPDLVVRDDAGRPYAVRYEAVNAMLLNEFLKEHQRVETLQATVTELKSALQDQSDAIEKIRNEVETAKRTPILTSSD